MAPEQTRIRQTGIEHSVEAIHLTKRFGDFTAVNDVSFQVAKGEIFGFLGPNGSGKTTTIRMLCGLMAPTSGEGRVLGYDVATEAEKIKPHIGYMSQRFSMYDDLTVWENLSFYADIYRVPLARRRVRLDQLVAMAGLTGREGELVGDLSGGWKQRLALGCAIVHEPPILFLDEPTGGVDPPSRRQFWDLIYELAATGVTVFVTTHFMDEAEHCHRIALMHQGTLVACDTPQGLRGRGLEGDLLEVDCDDPSRALEILSSQQGMAESALFGARLHVVVRSGQDEAGRIAELLTSHGVVVRQVERVQPTLEDAFVAMLGRKAPEARQQASSLDPRLEAEA